MRRSQNTGPLCSCRMDKRVGALTASIANTCHFSTSRAGPLHTPQQGSTVGTSPSSCPRHDLYEQHNKLHASSEHDRELQFLRCQLRRCHDATCPARWRGVCNPCGRSTTRGVVSGAGDRHQRRLLQAGRSRPAATDAEKAVVYRDQRRLAYPALADQLDMLYHDQVNGTTVWKDTIAAVKAANPKPAT